MRPSHSLMPSQAFSGRQSPARGSQLAGAPAVVAPEPLCAPCCLLVNRASQRSDYFNPSFSIFPLSFSSLLITPFLESFVCVPLLAVSITGLASPSSLL